ncbi:Hypothetical Protein NG00_00512 [Corynebacterium camporealensis]|uniref:Uncharacterized protein n=1 Tax=Corynebacterium camporealensis TaxID=161896 RepID=A0A0F6QX88_9CORY|nr:hypothetical protein [Corynebacterium camporealensis]AKE38543.1 hypothetical protein UL81_02810 [Corynebacterium camporealensis]AVH87840.1 Hypothetical Protein NG00_00512 [Corynebacterium camporealensis]
METRTTSNNFVAVPAQYNFNDAYSIGEPALRQLRRDMWDENPPFNGMPLQVYLKRRAITNKEQYANDFVMDAQLSKIAVQRSAEYIPSVGLRHRRPAQSCTKAQYRSNGCLKEDTATINGYGGWGNNLAGGQGNWSLKYFIQDGWGKGELAALKRANGNFDDGNGHLHHFLNPDNKYVGLGIVKMKVNGQIHTAAASTFAKKGSGTPNRLPDQRIEDNLYRAAFADENSTGIVTFDPNTFRGPQGGGGGGSSIGVGGGVIGIVTTVISILSIVGFVAQFIPQIQNTIRQFL